MSAGAIEPVFRNEAGRVLATLIRLVGDFELAEDSDQGRERAASLRAKHRLYRRALLHGPLGAEHSPRGLPRPAQGLG